MSIGADPNAREAGDKACALHFAAGYGHLETVRAPLDAGGDVHGFGERGARHHIFSAIAVGDLDRIQKLVEQNPETFDRRMSRFEQGRTPLHFAISCNRYDILDLLIELGADLEAGDRNGQNALAVAMLRGD